MSGHRNAPEALKTPSPKHPTADAARALGVSHWALWKAIASGRVEAERRGRCWLVTEDLASVARKLGAVPPTKAA